MQLVQLCEPAFQFICKLNRIGPKGHLDFMSVRAETKEVLATIAQKAGMDRVQAAVYEKVRLPLLFFIDSMIVEAGLQCSSEWDSQRLAYDHNELSGDEAFFDQLDQVLGGTDPDKAELLSFYFVCLGLGFTGIYFNQPEIIRDYIARMEPHLRSFLESDLHQRIVPDSYKYTNTANLIAAPAPKIFGILLCFVGVSLAVFIAVIFLYLNASRDLANAVTRVDQQRIEAPSR